MIVVVLKHSYITEIWRYFLERHGPNQNYMALNTLYITEISTLATEGEVLN